MLFATRYLELVHYSLVENVMREFWEFGSLGVWEFGSFGSLGVMGFGELWSEGVMECGGMGVMECVGVIVFVGGRWWEIVNRLRKIIWVLVEK